MNTNLKRFEERAKNLDLNDSLQNFRSLFLIPKDVKGGDKIYFCNNSLGLPAVKAFTMMDNQLKRWAELGVEGWFKGEDNWYSSLDQTIKSSLSSLLGANENEVVVMNSLTVNLHLLMVSFYQPTKKRYKILIDGPTFPSDLYAVKSQIRFHGLDPEDALVVIEPREREYLLLEDDIAEVLKKEGESIALVFLSSVNFLSGQVLDMQKLTRLAQEKGCLVGFDLAHAAGNIPLELHKWGLDFAVGCSYKYLCAGPGGPGLAFVHEKHHHSDLPRFNGWWGNDPKTRFRMQLQSDFVPYGGASSWQLSTPSVLSFTPFLASLEAFKMAGIDRLREKSKEQVAFLQELLDEMVNPSFEVITPRDIESRGCQLSLLFKEGAEEVLQALENAGVICDFRAPNILRVTPSPLYNCFYEVYDFVCRLNNVI